MYKSAISFWYKVHTAFLGRTLLYAFGIRRRIAQAFFFSRDPRRLSRLVAMWVYRPLRFTWHDQSSNRLNLFCTNSSVHTTRNLGV